MIHDDITTMSQKSTCCSHFDFSMNVCWWNHRKDGSRADESCPRNSDVCVEEPKVAMHIDRGDTESTIATVLTSHNSSFSSSEKDYPITGQYSDINIDYIISSVILGSGRYGTVKECTHRSSGQTFAVKSVEKSKVGRLEYLQREVHMLSIVDHENIIKMVDCYEDLQYVHIVTENCTGGELYDKVIRNVTEDGCLPEGKAARIIKQILRAVSYLHKKNCIHRDIKPENCMFKTSSEGSSIRLIDFGLSCYHSDEEPNLSARVGSCYYMSPQLLLRDYDRSADLWSVGVVAYILLCGYSPFNGDNDQEVIEAIHRCEYTFVHGWDDVSDDALDFIQSLLIKDPSKRLSADEALIHPWLKDVHVSDT